MEARFICPDCRLDHDRPADARVGHLVPCLDCALSGDFDETVRAGIVDAADLLAA